MLTTDAVQKNGAEERALGMPFDQTWLMVAVTKNPHRASTVQYIVMIYLVCSDASEESCPHNLLFPTSSRSTLPNLLVHSSSQQSFQLYHAMLIHATYYISNQVISSVFPGAKSCRTGRRPRVPQAEARLSGVDTRLSQAILLRASRSWYKMLQVSKKMSQSV